MDMGEELGVMEIVCIGCWMNEGPVLAAHDGCVGLHE